MLGFRRFSQSVTDATKSLLRPPQVRGHRRSNSSPMQDIPRISIEAPSKGDADTLSIGKGRQGKRRSLGHQYTFGDDPSLKTKSSTLAVPTQKPRPNSFHEEPGIKRPLSMLSNGSSWRNSISSLHSSDLVPFYYAHFLSLPIQEEASGSVVSSGSKLPTRRFSTSSGRSAQSQRMWPSIGAVLEGNTLMPHAPDARLSLSSNRSAIVDVGSSERPPLISNNSVFGRLSSILRARSISPFARTATWVSEHAQRAFTPGHSRRSSGSSILSASSHEAVSLSDFPTPPPNNAQLANPSQALLQTNVAAHSSAAPLPAFSLFPPQRANPIADHVQEQFDVSRARMLKAEEQFWLEKASSGRSPSPDPIFDDVSDSGASQLTRKTVASDASSQRWPVNVPMRRPRPTSFGQWSMSSGAESAAQWLLEGAF